MRATAIIVALLVCVPTLAATLPTVGMEGRVEIDLPGRRLEARPVNEKAPLVLRIASVVPGGDRTSHYDLRYIGLVPGKHDLKDYLARADGSSVEDLPPIPVEVAPLLPENYDGQLVPMAPTRSAWFGGYRMAGVVVVAAWLLLLVPLIFVRRKKRADEATAPPPRPLTLADRLRPLLDRAAGDTLSADDKGRLERMLLAHWQRRLKLAGADPAAAITAMRDHPEAGALLRSLEDWLHRPPGTSRAFADVAALLEPYRHVADPIET
jgi:hypothetical protein